MTTNTTIKSVAGFVFGAVTLISLIPWFIVQFQQSVNVDMAWLTIAATRLLGGDSMSSGFYDTNPPLSILIQLVPAALTRYAHVPLYDAVFFYSLLLAILSAMAAGLIARHAGLIDKKELPLLLAVYFFANTFLTSQYFGERDQQAMLGLFPLLLIQLALTAGKKLPGPFITITILIAGSVAALIKPFYLLIPALLLLHRAITQRRLSVFWRDPDSLALAGVTLVYLFIVFFFFSDFVYIILPDTLKFYVGSQTKLWVYEIAAAAALCIFCLLVVALLIPANHNQMPAILLLAALFSIIPYAAQGKGFFYHMIPATTLIFCALALILYRLTAATFLRWPAITEIPAAVAVFIVMATASYYYLPLNRAYPTHNDYRRSELAELIYACGIECPFFMFNDMTEIPHQLAVYTGQVHASRFPAYWFLPPMLRADYQLRHHLAASMTADQLAFYKKKYAALVAQDFTRYQPKLLIIGQFRIISEDKKPFNFQNYFSVNSEFTREWETYKFVKDITVNRRLYFGNTLYGLNDDTVVFKIYEKKEP